MQAIVDAAVAADAVIIPFGGGSNIAGSLEPPADEARHGRVARHAAGCDKVHRDRRGVAVSPASRPACPGPDLEEQLNAKGWTIGHFPDCFTHSTLGGWVATRSSGMQSDKYGDIADIARGLRVVRAGGVLVLRPLPSTSTGPSVREMILGSEGRLGVITEVTVQVHRVPEKRDDLRLLLPELGGRHRRHAGDRRVRGPPSITRVSDAPETRLLARDAARAARPSTSSRPARAAGAHEAARAGNLEQHLPLVHRLRGQRRRTSKRRRSSSTRSSRRTAASASAPARACSTTRRSSTPRTCATSCSTGAPPATSRRPPRRGRSCASCTTSVDRGRAEGVRRDRRQGLDHVPPVALVPLGRVPLLHVRVPLGDERPAGRVRPRQERDPAGVRRQRRRRSRTTTGSGLEHAPWLEQDISAEGVAMHARRCSTAPTRAATSTRARSPAPRASASRTPDQRHGAHASGTDANMCSCPSRPTILHADLDAFYASVEQRDDPRLRGRPVIVGGGRGARGELRGEGVRRPDGDGRRARRGGCARRRSSSRRACRPTPRRARRCSTVFGDTTPLVEGLSIDEAFLDVRGLRRIAGTPEEIAVRLRRERARRGRAADHGRGGADQVPRQGGERRGEARRPARGAARRRARLPPSAAGRAAVGRRAEDRGEAATRAGSRRSARWPQLAEATLVSMLGRASGRQLHALAHNRDPRPVRHAAAAGARSARSAPSAAAPSRRRSSRRSLVGLVDRARPPAARRAAGLPHGRRCGCGSTTSRGRRGRTRCREATARDAGDPGRGARAAGGRAAADRRRGHHADRGHARQPRRRRRGPARAAVRAAPRPPASEARAAAGSGPGAARRRTAGPYRTRRCGAPSRRRRRRVGARPRLPAARRAAAAREGRPRARPSPGGRRGRDTDAWVETWVDAALGGRGARTGRRRPRRAARGVARRDARRAARSLSARRRSPARCCSGATRASRCRCCRTEPQRAERDPPPLRRAGGRRCTGGASSTPTGGGRSRRSVGIVHPRRADTLGRWRPER